MRYPMPVRGAASLGRFSPRQMLPTEEVESSPLSLCDQWGAVERGWDAGTRPDHFEFVAGRPVQFFVGGAGGSRFPSMCPAPILCSFCRAAPRLMIDVQGLSMAMVGARCVGLGSLSHRAKPASASGHTYVNGPRDSARFPFEDQIPFDETPAQHTRAVSVKSGIV